MGAEAAAAAAAAVLRAMLISPDDWRWCGAALALAASAEAALAAGRACGAPGVGETPGVLLADGDRLADGDEPGVLAAGDGPGGRGALPVGRRAITLLMPTPSAASPAAGPA